jgi:ribosomal protein L21E
VTAELEYVETMRHASRKVERDGLDWPALRRAVLAYGGIGPSRDWPRDYVPAGLYRVTGKAPDLVAAEAMHPAPWGEGGDDAAMMAYLCKSWAAWQARTVEHRVAKPAPARKLKPGERSFAELVAELQRKHGADVDLSGLRSEYVQAYETGERVTIVKRSEGMPPMTYRGTVGATRGPRPRFVLLLSMDL